MRDYVVHVRAVGFSLALASAALMLALLSRPTLDGNTMWNQLEFVRRVSERWANWTVKFTAEQQSWLSQNNRYWIDPFEMSRMRWITVGQRSGQAVGRPVEWELAVASRATSGACEIGEALNGWSPVSEQGPQGYCGKGPPASLSEFESFWQGMGDNTVFLILEFAEDSEFKFFKNDVLRETVPDDRVHASKPKGPPATSSFRLTLSCSQGIYSYYRGFGGQNEAPVLARPDGPVLGVACANVGDEVLAGRIVSRNFVVPVSLRGWLRDEFGESIYWRRPVDQASASELLVELYQNSSQSRESPLSEIAANIRARDIAERDAIEFVGISLRPDELAAYGAAVVLCLQLTFLVYLTDLAGRTTISDEVAWIGHSPDPLARCLAISAYSVLPAASCGWSAWLDGGWLYLVGLPSLLVAYLVLCQLRKVTLMDKSQNVASTI